MNYRHIYHAGNFADVFKHIIIFFCLEKLHEKATSFFALDTHAGIAKYNLSDEKSLKTFEAEEGIKKLLLEKNFADFFPPRFLNILAKINDCEIFELSQKLKIYCGSPTIIKDFLRRDDRAIFAELNREDFLQLRKAFAGNQKFSLMNEDGFSLLKSKLPPLEKRGLIVIDPAFEKDQSKISADYEKIILSLKEAQKRFAHGVYVIWHPIIKSDEELLKKFYAEMSELKFTKMMHTVFDVGSKEGETKMSACGVFIINAPWELEKNLNVVCPKILEVLKKGEGAKFLINKIRE
jgi:23S rRNA (adenine2030-N6)-methyltransferase